MMIPEVPQVRAAAFRALTWDPAFGSVPLQQTWISLAVAGAPVVAAAAWANMR